MKNSSIFLFCLAFCLFSCQKSQKTNKVGSPEPTLLASYQDAAQAIARFDSLRLRADQPRAALTQLLPALVRAEAALPHPDSVLAMLYHKAGLACNDLNLPDSLVFFHKKALALRRQLYGDHAEDFTGRNCYNIGEALVTLNRPDEAMLYFDSALAIRLRLPDSTKIGDVFERRGILFRETNDFFRSETELLRALDFYKKPADRANCRLELGHLYDCWHRPEKASAAYESALVAAEDSAAVFNDFGVSLTAANQFQAARAALERSAQLCRASHRDGLLAKTLNNLSSVFVKLDDPRVALRAADASFLLKKKQFGRDFHPEMASIFDNRADAFSSLADFSKALEAEQQAVRCLVPSLADSSVFANPMVGGGAFLGSKTQLFQFLNHKEILLERLAEQKPTDLFLLKTALQTCLKLDTLADQIRRFATAEESKFWLGERDFSIYERGVRLSMQLFEQTKQAVWQEQAFFFAAQSKAAVLREMLHRSQLKRDLGVSPDELRAEKTALFQLAQLDKRSADEPSNDSLRRARFVLADEIDRRQRRLEHDFPALRRANDYATAPRVADLQSRLDDSTMLVEFFTGKNRLTTFVCTRSRFEVRQTDLPTDFEAICQQFHRATSQESFITDSTELAEKLFFQTAPRLFDLLLREPLAGWTGRRLFLVPDGELARLPFACLLTEPYRGSWLDTALPVLIKKQAVSELFCSSLLVEKPLEKKSPRYGFGGFGADYRQSFSLSSLKNERDSLSQNSHLLAMRGGGLDTLDNADDEVDSLAQLTGGRKWVNAQATKANFLAQAPLCGILHIALHTVEAESRDLSGYHLVFSQVVKTDEFVLSPEELMQLDLNADLVVVSACQSGFGNIRRGEGVMSLGRSLALSGCQSTVVNLWKADDVAARKLMISFYKNLKTGATKDLALQRAMLDYLDSARSKKTMPLFWANFVAIGDMAPVQFLGGGGWANWVSWLAGVGLILTFFYWFLSKKRRNGL